MDLSTIIRPFLLQMYCRQQSQFIRRTIFTSRTVCIDNSVKDGDKSSTIDMDMKSAKDVETGLVNTFLNLERLDNNLYRAHHLTRGRKSLDAVYGGQVIGQALVAASATVHDDFIPHSLHSYFLKSGKSGAQKLINVTSGSVLKPILYMIDRVRDGRSFCTRCVKGVQDGEAIYTAEISFHKHEPDSINHQPSMPRVVGPDQLTDIRPLIVDHLATHGKRMNSLHRAVLNHKLKELPPAFDRTFQIRIVEADKYLFKTSEHDYTMHVWLKAVEDIGSNARLHQCVAAYISDGALIEAALVPHLSRGFIPSMVFSLDHSIWMHRQHFRTDEWMLYEMLSPISNASRAFMLGRLWSIDGSLLMSTAQEGLVRAPQ